MQQHLWKCGGLGCTSVACARLCSTYSGFSTKSGTACIRLLGVRAREECVLCDHGDYKIRDPHDHPPDGNPVQSHLRDIFGSADLFLAVAGKGLTCTNTAKMYEPVQENKYKCVNIATGYTDTHS